MIHIFRSRVLDLTGGSFFYNGGYVTAYGPISNPNPNLKWETKDELDFGFDFTYDG